MAAAGQRFRFRPRYRGVAWTAIAVGAAIAAVAALAGLPWPAIAAGVAGVALGAFYLVSPTWSIEVAVDDAALEVLQNGDRRFRLPWSQVKEVVASPATKTCFVDGGDADSSLLVPGEGAPAPYAISDKEALYDFITSHVAADRVVEVALLETHGAGPGEPPVAPPSASG